MAKKTTLQKLNPKPKGKVQKSKVQKLKPNMTLLARSESLTEREYTYEPHMDVQPLVEGTDLNMIKQEEIELETETMECDEVGQLPSNSVPIASDEMVKNEPQSFVVKEEFSNPDHAKITVSIPARKQKKCVAKEKQKLANEREKIAKAQVKRQNKRARNPDRHKENIAQLPDYSEISLNFNQELADTNLNDNDIAVESSDAIERNVTEILNTEAELNSRTLSNNVSSIDIGNGQESNTGDAEAETQYLHIMDASVSCDTSQEVERLTNVDETTAETGIDVDNVGELSSISSNDFKSEANTGDVEVHNLDFSGTSMADDTNQIMHSTIAGSVANIGGKRYNCSHCSYASNRSGNLLKHSRTHTGDKPYKCDQCSFASAQPSGLKLHIRIHTGEKPSKCNQCSYASANSSGLKLHMLTHTGEKPYKCTKCSYAGATAGHLNTHILTHSGEKPFKCNQCSYACAQSGSLKRHMRSHNGEKPYKCSHCTYASLESSDLKNHIRIHTGEKPYKCSQCSFASAQPGNLKKHIRTHTGEKPYKCSKCSYACARADSLKWHMRTHI